MVRHPIRFNDGARERRRDVARSMVAAFSVAAVLLAAVFASSAQAQSVGLGTADSFAVLGGSTITNTGPTVIRGDLGLSPGSALIGAPLVTDGTAHVNDTVAQQAQLDLTTAYDDAAGRSSTGTISADLAGRTLTPGVYTSATSLGLSGDLTLDGQGNPDAVFIFQAGSTLTTASGSRVILTGAAQACNVFWQVGDSATIGTATAFTGSILALTSITLTTGATVQGRTLARNGAVTLDTNRITRSACATPVTPDTSLGTAPVGASGATPVITGPAVRTTRVLRRRGTARLVPGPRSGPLQGPPRAGRCVTKPFTMRVTGRSIRQVSFFSNGRRLGTVKATPGRKVFSMRVVPRRQRGVSRVTARVSFTAASRTKSRTLRATYRRCQSVQPRFTG